MRAIKQGDPDPEDVEADDVEMVMEDPACLALRAEASGVGEVEKGSGSPPQQTEAKKQDQAELAKMPAMPASTSPPQQTEAEKQDQGELGKMPASTSSTSPPQQIQAEKQDQQELAEMPASTSPPQQIQAEKQDQQELATMPASTSPCQQTEADAETQDQKGQSGKAEAAVEVPRPGVISTTADAKDPEHMQDGVDGIDGSGHGPGSATASADATIVETVPMNAEETPFRAKRYQSSKKRKTTKDQQDIAWGPVSKEALQGGLARSFESAAARKD